MFEVRSYICAPKSFPDLEYIEVTETALLKQIAGYLDFYEPEGYIDLRYFNMPVFSCHVAFIDLVWKGFIDFIVGSIHHKEYSYHFLEVGSVRLKLLRTNTVLFSFVDKNWYLPKKEFFLQLIEGALSFFSHMNLALRGKYSGKAMYDDWYKECFTAKTIIFDHVMN